MIDPGDGFLFESSELKPRTKKTTWYLLEHDLSTSHDDKMAAGSSSEEGPYSTVPCDEVDHWPVYNPMANRPLPNLPSSSPERRQVQGINTVIAKTHFISSAKIANFN